MGGETTQNRTLLDHYWLIFGLIVLIQIVFVAISIDPAMFDKHYPDGAMRLLSVRDLLAGQAWFDTTQHRVLPPDGLDLHWSRLIDAGIGALVLFFGLFLSPQSAEIAAIATWPTLLLLVYIAIIGVIARNRFTPKIASFAIFAAAFSPYTYETFFSPGSLDHHNVQVVCIAAIFWSLVAEGQDRKHGVIGGLATAVSLAVGLEMALFILLVMLIFLVNLLRGAEGVGTRMTAFGLSLGGAALALFVLQTGPADWNKMYCDELAPPVLAVTTATAVLGVLLPRAIAGFTGLGPRILIAASLIGVTGAITFGALGPCLASPYANVPLEVRQAVIAANLENYSVLLYFLNAPVQGIAYVLPLILVIAMLYPTLSEVSRGQGARRLLVLFSLFALAAAMFQVRLIFPGFALLPLAFGIVAADFVATRLRGVAFVLQTVAIFTLIFTPLVAMALVMPFQRVQPERSLPFDFNCLDGNKMGRLGDLPAAVVFTPLNLGPKVLLYTHHSVTGASYHRSADALVNGMLRFIGTREELAQAVAETGSSYVIVCRGQPYSHADSVGSKLARGEPVEGLRELEGPEEAVMIFEVLPSFTD